MRLTLLDTSDGHKSRCEATSSCVDAVLSRPGWLQLVVECKKQGRPGRGRPSPDRSSFGAIDSAFVELDQVDRTVSGSVQAPVCLEQLARARKRAYRGGSVLLYRRLRFAADPGPDQPPLLLVTADGSSRTGNCRSAAVDMVERKRRTGRRSRIPALGAFLAALSLVGPSKASHDSTHPHRAHLKHGSPSNEAGATLDILEAASRASNESLMWGTYRPNLYFGMRSRQPKSLMMGLVWWSALTPQGYASTSARDIGRRESHLTSFSRLRNRGKTRLRSG